MGYFEENGYSLSTGLHSSAMAYSRFRRRRSFRRRPARTLRRSQQKRTVRRRRFVRRPRRRMTSRRVRNIASRKKHDTQLGGDSNAPDASNPVTLLQATIIFWAPTYLEQHEESWRLCA